MARSDFDLDSQLYLSLFVALTEVQSEVTVYLLEGEHGFEGSEESTVTIQHNVTIKTLLCEERPLPGCASGPATLRLTRNFLQIRVLSTLLVSDLTFDSDYSLLPPCLLCSYCPATSLLNGQLINDRGEAISQAADQSLCDIYANKTFLSVQSGRLELRSVAFINFRQQLKALLWSHYGAIQMWNVTISNVVTEKGGGAILMEGGTLKYEGGLVEYVNNGYELGSVQGNFGNLGSFDTVGSVDFSGVVVRYSLASGALISMRNIEQISISNCTFYVNVVSEAVISMHFSNATVRNCSFVSNFGAVSSGLSLSQSASTEVANCTFDHNFATSIGPIAVQSSIFSSRTNFSHLVFSQNQSPYLLFLNSTSSLTLASLSFLRNDMLTVSGANEVMALYTALPGAYAKVISRSEFKAEDCTAFIYSHDVTNISVNRAEFRQGQCLYGSAGVVLKGNTTDVSISSLFFEANQGGTLLQSSIGSDLVLFNLTFSGNSNPFSLQAACISLTHSRPSHVSLLSSCFSHNHALASAVAWVTGLSLLVVQDSVIWDNIAETSCAGIAFMPLLSQASELQVLNTSFARNTAKSAVSVLISTNELIMTNESRRVNLQVKDCEFVNNSAEFHGCGVTLLDFLYLTDTSQVLRTRFEGNDCVEGGSGLYVEFTLGTLTVSKSNFTRNRGMHRAAAIVYSYTGAVPGRGVMKAIECSFFGNQGESVVRVAGDQRCSFETANCTFQANSGSCLSASNCLLTDFHSRFAQNTAEKGAALLFEVSTVTLVQGYFVDNSVETNGGAIYATLGSKLTCVTCTMERNKALVVGGGIYMDQDSQFTGTNAVLLSNYAGDRGSALYADKSTVTLTNVTAAFNSAGNYGTLFFSASKLTMSDCDMSYNLARGRSSGVSTTLSTITVSDCRFHDQTAPLGAAFYLTDQSTGVVSRSQFWNNTAGSGGSIVVIALSTFNLVDSSLKDCSSVSEGGMMIGRISTITLTRVKVQNIQSVLSYGAVFLLQGAFTVQGCTFTDLQGSMMYATATVVTITNTSVSRVFAGLGGAVHCSECKGLVVTNSTFADNVAKVGGVIYSYTKGTSSTIFTANFYANVFRNNTAVNGGAIYTDSFYVNLTQNAFIQNSANAASYADAEMLFRGLGGAVYIACPSIVYCAFLVLNNTFTENKAQISGGAVYWADSYPVISGSKLSANWASYGSDIGSYAVRLMALDANDTVLSYLEQGEHPLIGRLENVGSGYEYKGSVRLALVDQYDTIVATDLASSAQLSTPNTSKAVVVGHTETVAVKGVFVFSGFTVVGPPLTTQLLLITTNGVDLTRKNSAKDPSDYYATVSLLVTFRACVSGEAQQANGQCRPCPVNTFSLNPEDPCIGCPSHATCYGRNAMVPNPGYWRPGSSHTFFFECINPDACLGSPDPAEPIATGLCAKGYRGNLCNDCDENYSTQGNGLCSQCPSLFSNIILCSILVLLVACLFVLVVFISLRSAMKPRSELAIYTKIMLNYVQMVMVASSLNMRWPTYVERFLRGQQTAGNAADQLLSVDCLLKQFSSMKAFYSNLTLYVTLPALAMGLSALWWIVAAILLRSEQVWRKLVATLVLIVFVLHTSLTKVLFSAFACRELLSGEYWLSANLAIRCWDEEHISNLAQMALPGIVVWVIGLPTITLMQLVMSKNTLGDSNFRLQYSFLYKGYRPNWYFWEFVILYRKILLVCVSVFLTSVSIVVQALSMLAVMLACLFVQLYVRPFLGSTFNNLELKALLASLITIYAGLYFQTDSTRKTHTDSIVDIVLFGLIILANAGFLLSWLRLVVPIVLLAIKERWAALRKYQIHPLDLKHTKSLNVSSKLQRDGSEAPSVVPPDSFEVPENSSITPAVTPVQEDVSEVFQ